MSETLSLKERLQYYSDVKRGRSDPIWFMREILGWKKIWPKQEEIIRQVYQHKYDPSLPEIKELAWISGQRSGKSVTVGHLGAYEFFEIASLDDPAEHYGLMRKQPIAISCIAAGKEQAIDGIYTLLSTALEESEWVQQWWGNKLKFSDSGRIDFRDKNLFVQVKAARADTGAGYTSKCVIFDELDLFQKNTDSKISAENVFRKLVNSTMTLGVRGKVFSISSLDNVDGMMSTVYYKAIKKQNAIALNYKTWEVNPSPDVSEAFLRKEFEFDMESFYKYFANRPDISSGLLFPGGVKLDKSIPNVLQTEDQDVLDEASNYYHALAVDPGHRNDSFGLSVGHRIDNHIIIDGVMKFEKQGEDAYIKPSDIEEAMTSHFDKLNVTDLLYDIDTILYMVEKAEKDWGITTFKRIADSEAYGIWWNLNEGKDPEFTLSITYDEHLKRECDQLQKLKTATGRAKIDHPYSGSKDCADTVANLIWYLKNNESSNSRNPTGHMSMLY